MIFCKKQPCFMILRLKDYKAYKKQLTKSIIGITFAALKNHAVT